MGHLPHVLLNVCASVSQFTCSDITVEQFLEVSAVPSRLMSALRGWKSRLLQKLISYN